MKIIISISIFFTFISSTFACNGIDELQLPSEIEQFALKDCSDFLYSSSPDKDRFCECQNLNYKKISKSGENEFALQKDSIKILKGNIDKYFAGLDQAFMFLNDKAKGNVNAQRAASSCSLKRIELPSSCPGGNPAHFLELKSFIEDKIKQNIGFIRTAYLDEKKENNCLSNRDVQEISSIREVLLLETAKKSNSKYDRAKRTFQPALDNQELRSVAESSNAIISYFEKRGDANNLLDQEISGLEKGCNEFIENVGKLACTSSMDFIPKSIKGLALFAEEEVDPLEGTATQKMTEYFAPYCSAKSNNDIIDRTFLHLSSASLPGYFKNTSQSIDKKTSELSTCLCQSINNNSLEKLINENNCNSEIDNAKEISSLQCNNEKIYCSHIVAMNLYIKDQQADSLLAKRSIQANENEKASASGSSNSSTGAAIVKANLKKDDSILEIFLGDKKIQNEKSVAQNVPAEAKNSQLVISTTTDKLPSKDVHAVKNDIQQNYLPNSSDESFYRDLENRMFASAMSSRGSKGYTDNSQNISTKNSQEISSTNRILTKSDESQSEEENDEEGQNHSVATKKAKPSKRKQSDTAQGVTYQAQENAPVNYVTNNSTFQNTTPIAQNNSISQNSADVFPTDSTKEKEVVKTPIGLPAKNQDGTIKNAANSTMTGNSTNQNSSPSNITINSKPSNNSNGSGGINRETEVVFNEKAVDKEFVVQPDKLKPEEVKALRGLLDSGEPFNIRLSQHENFKVKVVPGANNEISLIAPTQMETNPEYQKFVANMKDFIQSQTRGGNLKKLKLMFTTT